MLRKYFIVMFSKINYSSDCYCLVSWIYISTSTPQCRISVPGLRSIKNIAKDGDKPSKFGWKIITKPELGSMIAYQQGLLSKDKEIKMKQNKIKGVTPWQ